MSELEPSSLDASHDAPRARDTDFAALISDRPEREGLPRSYRMRADAHYVDQLDRPLNVPVVRLIATRQIDGGDPPPASLSSLRQSIVAHGILQPLLVRRSGGRYQMIAGRKRLAAAVAAGLTEVPCIVHEVSDSAAGALAEAENLRTPPNAPSPHRADHAGLLDLLARDLSRIGTLADVLALGSDSFQHRAAADLMKAEAWRAAWLAGVASLLDGPQAAARTVSAARIADQVRSGFGPESRVTRLQLDVGVAADAADASCDERTSVVLTGLVFTAMAWMHGCDHPRVDVRLDAPASQTLRVQVVERQVPPPADEAGSALTLNNPTPRIALEAARRFAAEYGGGVDVTALGQRGALIQTVFDRLHHG